MMYEVERNGEVVKVKQCKKCMKYKLLDVFYLRPSGTYDGYCRKCKNKQSAVRHRERYQADEQFREAKRKQNRENHAKRKMEATNYGL